MSMLTAENVELVYRASLYTDDEIPGEVSLETLPEGAIVTDGVLNQTGFHPGRVAEHRTEILGMLSELPTAFRADMGGGWSFLNACVREDGEQWTGMHRTVDMLFQLGQAIGAVTYALPREMWSVLPGGMPYMVVRLPTEPADVAEAFTQAYPDLGDWVRDQHNANVARSAAYREPGI